MNQQPTTVKQKLVLMQLSDSFFPSGSYTLSHGLESLINLGKIKQPEDLIIFLQLLLANKIASSDLVALIHAHGASASHNLEAIRQADSQLFALNAIAITRKTQRQSGRALLMVARSTWQHEQLEILAGDRQFNFLHPVVFGVVGNIAGLSVTDTVLAFLHGLVTGILGAAIRLGILGHVQAQQILQQLAPDIEAACDYSFSLKLEQMWSCTPMIDLAQMCHSKLSTRLFAS